MKFGVLGPLEVTAQDQPVAVRGARTRAVLAVLLVHANHVVPTGRRIDELWEADRLVTRPPGYLIRVTADELDALQFENLVLAGRDALTGGDSTAAARLLQEALALWRGPALADLGDHEFAEAERTRLGEGRLSAVELRMDALLLDGRHSEIVGELEALTGSFPLRERFWAQRMLALYRCGRQADALRAYRELRAILVEQLGIEPGPELRELETRFLQQDGKLDYRPSRPGRGAEVRPETRYVESGGIHIAYQVLGHGERDIVFVPGLMSHLELLWEDPETSHFFRRLSTLGRLILFDKRDTGLSDRAPGDSSLEERMDDVRAVMRAAESDHAVLFGYSEGAAMSILFAATYPDRVTALILGSAAARWFAAAGYPCGERAEEMYQALTEIAEQRWGQGDTIDWYLQSRAGSAHARELVGRFERMAIGPSAFLRMLRMIHEIDVRVVLPAIHVPTLVIQRLDDRITPPYHGRYLASHIAGARYFEQAGDHSLRFSGSGDSDGLFDELEDFLAGAPPGRSFDRVLATVLVARAAAATTPREAAVREQACASGQDGYGAAARYQVRSHRGRVIRLGEGSVLATFEAPGQAIRCAAALRDHAANLGIQTMAGIHTGELDLVGDDIAGASVELTRDLLMLARPAEILVSRTVKDLVVGSGMSFADRGSHQLGGILETWQLFAVTEPGR